MSAVCVVVEQRAGRVPSTSLEVVTAARQLSDEVEALLCGPIDEPGVQALSSHGATRIVVVEGDDHRLVAPRLAAVVALRARNDAVDAVIFPSTPDGRDVAARTSVRLDRPVLANVAELSRRDGAFVARHELFGATVALESAIDGSPGLYLLRAKAVAASALGQANEAEVVNVVAEDSAGDGAEIIGRTANDVSGPDLDLAKVVVSGGRGLGDQGSYHLIEELAELLGGAPAASRAVVDAGWVPYAYQVGQTGKTVAPDLYLACGISGATQHIVGMKQASHVIAINTDEQAPIFKVADLGIVGDVHSVLPALIEALRARRG